MQPLTAARTATFVWSPLSQDNKSTEAWKEYKKSKQNAKRVISLAKGKKQKECASDLNDLNQQNEIFQIAGRWLKKDRI